MDIKIILFYLIPLILSFPHIYYYKQDLVGCFISFLPMVNIATALFSLTLGAPVTGFRATWYRFLPYLYYENKDKLDVDYISIFLPVVALLGLFLL